MPTQDLAPLLVSPEGAAKLLGVGRSLIYELLADGKLASLKIGTARRIRVAEVERFIEATSAP